MNCLPTQARNKSYEDLIKLIDIINDNDINKIKKDISDKKFSRTYMCILFELICRKYTSDNLIYHLKEDSIFMKLEFLNIIF